MLFFVLQNASAADSAIYKILAKNDGGDSQALINLTVDDEREPPYVIDELEEIQMKKILNILSSLGKKRNRKRRKKMLVSIIDLEKCVYIHPIVCARCAEDCYSSRWHSWTRYRDMAYFNQQSKSRSFFAESPGTDNRGKRLSQSKLGMINENQSSNESSLSPLCSSLDDCYFQHRKYRVM